MATGLDDVYVVFEMKTPISNKAIDVLVLGYSDSRENRVLIVELKQWSNIYTKTKKHVLDDLRIKAEWLKGLLMEKLEELLLRI